MILTQCAVCATDLGLSLGKKCGRCSTRYCGPECQVQHWKEGGHDTLCKPIKRAGGAEQYNANKKYTEAVAVAVEKCADDTKGQTCYICTQALHWKTKEGLVRGCSCRGTAGLVHVSCLVEQAKILVAEAEENNLHDKAFYEKWRRWFTCSLYKQEYHGIVRCALGWACWKTYLGRPETDWARRLAMTQLGGALTGAGHHEDALVVKEATLAMMRRVGSLESDILAVQNNLANAYRMVGRTEQALQMRQDIYSGYVKLLGKEHERTIRSAHNYVNLLLDLRRIEEAKSLLTKTIPVAQRVFGACNDTTLRMRMNYATTLYGDPTATLDDIRKAVTTLEEIEKTARRVFGGAHPTVAQVEGSLQYARDTLCDREMQSAAPPSPEDEPDALDDVTV